MNLKQVFQSLDHFPTTRVRLLVTIGLITATGITYLVHACSVRIGEAMACSTGWEPSLNWLLFLSALAGVDVTQYFAKSYTAVKQSEVDASVTNAHTRAAASVTNANTLADTPITNTTVPAVQLVVEEIDFDDVTSTSDLSELNRENESKG